MYCFIFSHIYIISKKIKYSFVNADVISMIATIEVINFDFMVNLLTSRYRTILFFTLPNMEKKCKLLEKLISI